MTSLRGTSLTRAKEILKLTAELGDGASLLSKENLIECGFTPVEGSFICLLYFLGSHA